MDGYVYSVVFSTNENTIRDEGSTALYTAYTPFTVNTVNTV